MGKRLDNIGLAAAGRSHKEIGVQLGYFEVFAEVACLRVGNAAGELFFHFLHTGDILKGMARLVLVPGADGAVQLLLVLALFLARRRLAGLFFFVAGLCNRAVQHAANTHNLIVQTIFFADMVLALGADGHACHLGLQIGGSLQKQALILGVPAVVLHINGVRLPLVVAAAVFFIL